MSNETGQEQVFEPAYTSKVVASVGRMVHVYSTEWGGPRPGIVVSTCSGSTQLVNVNVILDSCNDHAFERIGYRTLCALPMYDALSEENRAMLLKTAPAKAEKDQPYCWCEWMPFVAAGVAPKPKADGTALQMVCNAAIGCIRVLARSSGKHQKTEIEKLLADVK